ncbi:Cobaltochelatase [Methanolacinia petrolearia DSM 11571]|uniref:Cobaltochelatase n=1 Tax=Methanolacinia petrolearia (strain DSM 11571 / OCM 486 / SEBR 4847) TaxID=679926 RepID=E1RI22_METP4|nr:cobaltochelatase subunit CobN [Methanolacinia petrolearia]ADN35407.1 Cobaltochelatase [Methanolacinia petrolearia DSM 11571]
MKVTAVMWGTYAPVLKKAAELTGDDLVLFTNRMLDEYPEMLEKALSEMKNSDAILLYHRTEPFWERLDRELKTIGHKIPVISLGHDPTYWGNSTVKPEIVTTCQAYISYNGEENLKNLLYYIQKSIFNEEIDVKSPIEVPWEGIYHPGAESCFLSIDDYLSWYSEKEKKGAPWVGIIFSRTSWVSNNCSIEDSLISSLEDQGLNVVPVFTYAMKDDAIGSKGIAQVVIDFMTKNGTPKVNAIIKLIPFLFGASRSEGSKGQTAMDLGINLLKKLNIPIFHPVISPYKTVDQWRESTGLTLDTGWAVSMPEFEGVIEPIYIGSTASTDDGDKKREAVPERCRKVAIRVKKWIALAQKPVQERKITFILNNNPCANADANVGAAANLDSLESVARIMQKMEKAGYQLNPPASGKELVEEIMGKKAMSEFRWTTKEDIAAKGGVLMYMDMDAFTPYFNSLPESVQKRVNELWGEPPGLGMVLDGKILITGLQFGNVTVQVQPKRGCYGSRCDGAVCKILHDPECPPTHQYLATYYWIEHIFGADAIVHVGTHGNLEFLPGKGLGLSGECFPDVAIGSLPNLYIYNADNPAEGTTAKRRSYATLVDHMQTVMAGGGLYEELQAIEDLLSQYEIAKLDPARGHSLQHLLLDSIKKANLDKDMHITHETPLSEIVAKAHESLSRIRNTRIQEGMHVFGEIPVGDKRVDFINSIIHFDSGNHSPRRVIAQIIGLDLSYLLENQDKFSEIHDVSNGKLLENLDSVTCKFIDATLHDPSLTYNEIFSRSITPDQAEYLNVIRERILDINRRIEQSKEIESLLEGFKGKYIPSGPSGLITRGHEEVLPTGRNFYSLDPQKVPTKSSWIVGQRLADALISKYNSEEGSIPENVAFYWMAGDIMSSDGEMFAEMLWLIGVEPVWEKNGRVKSFSVVPLDQLGRPRIDITVRTSGILRDNFCNCYELLDEAVQFVAGLDESEEQNYIKKHSMRAMSENGTDFRDSTLRIFSSRPGTYSSGVNLAVLASAWKTEEDLADIFVALNGYAYGKDFAGKKAQEQLASSLSTVSVTFNKVQSDEYDLLGCCCYFGTHGGITAAARHYSESDVKPYYGDTREPEHIEIRDLADEVRRVVRTKLLNPKWIDGMKEHGYNGASTIMKRVTRVYGWEASTQEVDDWIFDDIAETFVNNEEMRHFFENNNPSALEEIARRLLEAKERGLWEADEQVLADLRNNYLEIESWMEDQVGDGDFQGGNLNIITSNDVSAWGESAKDLLEKVHLKYPRNP